MRKSTLGSRKSTTGQALQENRAVPDPTGKAMARGPCLMTATIAAVGFLVFCFYFNAPASSFPTSAPPLLSRNW